MDSHRHQCVDFAHLRVLRSRFNAKPALTHMAVADAGLNTCIVGGRRSVQAKKEIVHFIEKTYEALASAAPRDLSRRK